MTLDSNDRSRPNVIREKTGGRGVDYLIEASGSGQ